MKKKTKRKAREWELRVFPDGAFCENTTWHHYGERVRVREILPRKRAAKKGTKR